ncbi:MAG: alpha/beta fold hydrolase [Caldithrix sp.]|nr:alpha/beta fold hydrolase [Caldithrix sp.]
MKTQKINFTNREGQELAARLEFPVDQQPHHFAVFAHCFTCSKNLNAVRNISNGLTRNGFAVLRFDFTGLGESEGDFADTNFSSNVNDLVDAAGYLAEHYQAPVLLVGHSLGGSAVLLASKYLESVKAVTTIGAPFEPEHVKHLLQDSVETIERKGTATVSIGGRPFEIKKQFLDDIKSVKLSKQLAELRKALLIMHSPQDTTVGIDNAAQIYQAAKHPKSFITLDGADHLLSKKEDSFYAGQMIGNWAQRYIQIPKRDALKSQNQVAVRTGESGFTTEIKAGVHQLVADEPESVGGNDYGPNPYDYLVAGLGACTSMTLRMYADRKRWDVKEIKVHLDHQKIHCEDCEQNENRSSKIDFIERSIELEGELSDEQRQRLLEIADKCPVHRTLHSQIKVKTILVE